MQLDGVDARFRHRPGFGLPDLFRGQIGPAPAVAGDDPAIVVPGGTRHLVDFFRPLFQRGRRSRAAVTGGNLGFHLLRRGSRGLKGIQGSPVVRPAAVDAPELPA